MKIIVIGSGLIGVTTAYFLRRCGYEVTVIDRRDGPGQETSFANGALLTPSMADPWNSPGCWRVLLASLARRDSALQLRLRALPALALWGVSFLRNSSATAFTRNTLSNLRLALYSREVMSSLRTEERLEYGYRARGTLRVFRSPAALDHAVAAAERLSSEGMRFRSLSPSETVGLNPALASVERELTGALHYEDDESGDAHRFCVTLADRAREIGVEFCFCAQVSAMEVQSGRLAAVSVTVSGARQRLVADRYVVAAGSYSTPLLRTLGIDLPVRPAKGYSITFNQTPLRALNVPVVDDDFHAAIVPLEGAIRVAGTAEFAGFDLALRSPRILNLLRLLNRLLPEEQFDLDAAKPWCGLRPMSADGVPIIGETAVSNLYVNTGHGHLGWTLAAGSALLLTTLMSGDAPAIDPKPFAMARFVR